MRKTIWVLGAFLLTVLLLLSACKPSGDDNDSNNENAGTDDSGGDDAAGDDTLDDAVGDDSINDDAADDDSQADDTGTCDDSLDDDQGDDSSPQIRLIDGGYPGKAGTSVVVVGNGEILVAAEEARRLFLYKYRDQSVTKQKLADYASMPSMALDKSGKLHVVFLDFSTNEIIYMNNVSGCWFREIVDCQPGILEVHLALDGLDNPHIVYNNNSLFYSEKQGNHWVTQVLKNGTVINSAIMADRDGYAHIGYATLESWIGHILYLTDSSGNWVEQTVASTAKDRGKNKGTALSANFLVDPDIALDSTGTPHITYSNIIINLYIIAYSSTIMLAYDANGEWANVPIAASSTESWGNTHINLDNQDKIHLIFGEWRAIVNVQEYPVGPIYYWTDVGAPMEPVLVDDSGMSLSFVLDSNGNPNLTYLYFSYVVGVPAELKLASKTSVDWEYENLEAGYYIMDDVSLALDLYNYSHIAYSDYSNNRLKYASDSSSGWSLDVVDGNSTDVGNISLALDFNGFAHISYFDYGEHLVRYADNVDGSWNISNIVNSYTICVSTDIGVDSGSHSYILWSSGSDGLTFATNKTGSWINEFIGHAVTDDRIVSLAIGAEGSAHIAYYDGSGLFYLTNLSGSWAEELVDSDFFPGISISLDTEGYPHIIYALLQEIRYANRRSGSWVKEVVSQDGGLFQQDSLSLDGNGKAHFSFGWSAGDSMALNYATNKGGQWVISQIDTYGDYIGNASSLAVDSQNIAHVSYSGQNALWHATFPAGWTGAE